MVNRTSPTLALRQAAIPFMEDIQQVLNQNVNLAVLDGWEALFVERLSRRGSVRNTAKVAGRMPVHILSAGLALMAYQDKTVQGNYLDQFSDPSSLAATDAVRALLAETARQGSLSLRTLWTPTPGASLYRPVVNGRQRAVPALGVVVPLGELRLQALVPALQTAARGIGSQLPHS
ncbi:IclR family transcriptional regulator domain-containing protein [Arthrobacter sp. TS-15]|uniref:IclR family transcriptional regulator domain-containing protein n=1 Tax=Arthrobacter sp. TS-15 TaxID=2510797 RepID=UPI00406CDEA9